MSDSDAVAIVRDYFQAWIDGDRAKLEAALAEGFTFTSPYDDHIDTNTFFARCWPNQPQQKIELLSVAADGARVFVLYDCEVAGAKFRNAEVHTLAGRKVKSVEVYFGDPPLGIPRDKFLSFIENGRKTWRA